MLGLVCCCGQGGRDGMLLLTGNSERLCLHLLCFKLDFQRQIILVIFFDFCVI